jgi:catechol 2,3-dioxygenase-like lactoylglutathione lyase family enzyme
MDLLGITPVLRIFDVPLAKSFYVGYLGCVVDWEDGDPPDSPVYLQVSRGPLVLHLSTFHGDGTPGGVVLVEMRGIRELHAELHRKGYRFMNPGLEPGPGEHMLSTELIDPFGNLIRFFERGAVP